MLTENWYGSLHQTYVRDIYPFRRSVSPQLNLVHMLPEKGQELIQKQVSFVNFRIKGESVYYCVNYDTLLNSYTLRNFLIRANFVVQLRRYSTKITILLFLQVFSRKLEEIGRVLFIISLTQRMPAMHKQSHVSMLQEDLLRLPSFPRSAIDAEFTLFNEPLGK